MPATAADAVNYWPDSKCAKAFWQQADIPAYKDLLADTIAWTDPQPGQRWLDLGCGSGQLTRALWAKSGGKLDAVVGLDCAAVNAESYALIRGSVEPPPEPGQISFVAENFSGGLPDWQDEQFDGVVSGLSIQYAESYSPEHGWNTAAYDGLLRRVGALLKPGGSFVFSVNVPEPNWLKIGVQTIPSVFSAVRPLRYFKNVVRLIVYGRWIKLEARRGRFHYLPADQVAAKLAHAGFTAIQYRLSYARQAYVFRCRKLG